MKNENDISTMLIPVKRWLQCCLLFFLIACHNNAEVNKLVPSKNDSIIEAERITNAYREIDSLQPIIQSGDLITRTGNDFTSESLRTLNQHDKTYSHCGIASIEHDSIFVYHALGGEFNPDQKIRRDALELFAEPYDNRGIGIFRYQVNNTDIKVLMAEVKKLYTAGIMFDMKFNLADDDRMYCAEFVYKSYSVGTEKKLQFTTSKINDFEFVGVDDLFIHPLCSEIKRIVYK
ncbi:MAG: hypothetical protein IPP72_17570 [Chitinophagaceae bacterium]|nr:hypothetical protein [Chitinophagaceae bacterium]